MKIAVLGSEGQIGQYLCSALLDAGHEVMYVDLELGDDLRTPSYSTIYAIAAADLVYFLAFDVGGSQYLAAHQYSYQYIDNNISLMQNVFSLLERETTPFIFASSQMSNMLDSPYGMLKRIGEFCTQALAGVNVRFWNVYGKEQHPDKFHVITDFIKGAQQGAIHMRTTGDESRQFLHGVDCAAALVTLGDRFEELDNKTYYDVTSFEWTTIESLANLIANMYDAAVFPGIEWDHTQSIQNEPTDKILEYWKPMISLEEGIRNLMKEK